ncbi:uncharacterized protein DFL_006309 [Arthrobotrys flagrans]|uniref:Uncharacterized protein n=1 Tax=Arthrobotrys flagrans TaxID=97331 RepID=A0A437A0V0_ARTFL|nr:hypothetical protein DFL_006309 [Arthrobotrys flagrans]
MDTMDPTSRDQNEQEEVPEVAQIAEEEEEENTMGEEQQESSEPAQEEENEAASAQTSAKESDKPKEKKEKGLGDPKGRLENLQSHLRRNERDLKIKKIKKIRASIKLKKKILLKTVGSRPGKGADEAARKEKVQRPGLRILTKL